MLSRILWILFGGALLIGCSPVKITETNLYKLNTYAIKKHHDDKSSRTILITTTNAASAYESKQMLYMKQSFAINSFAQNAWISPPADMIFPLIIQSVQRSGNFRAVVGPTTNESADYRLDSELIELQQNFLQKPSRIQLSIKADLTDVRDGKILASKLFRYSIPTPTENPYGGVIAANQATRLFTGDLITFIRKYL